MTSPAGAINAPYRGASWTPQGYAPAQQAYRYTTPLAQQPAYAYTQHTTTTTVSPLYNVLNHHRIELTSRAIISSTFCLDIV